MAIRPRAPQSNPKPIQLPCCACGRRVQHPRSGKRAPHASRPSRARSTSPVTGARTICSTSPRRWASSTCSRNRSPRTTPGCARTPVVAAARAAGPAGSSPSQRRQEEGRQGARRPTGSAHAVAIFRSRSDPDPRHQRGYRADRADRNWIQRRVTPVRRPFASWLRLCPRTPISGGKPLNGRRNGLGANLIAGALRLAARQPGEVDPARAQRRASGRERGRQPE
jgi:hypothetical protein